jgi:membrane-bound lytic murein transglycosylase B
MRFPRHPLLRAMIRPLPLALCLLLSPTLALADPAPGYSGHPQAEVLYQTLRKDHGFSDEDIVWVRRALEQAQQMPQLIRAEQTAAEHTRTWTGYRPIHVNEANIRNGIRFYHEHRETLERAEAEYGVPPAIIVAILGVETKYGGYTGRSRVLDALTTQGFEHPRRTPFFFSELVAFFALCRDKGLDPTEPMGSYAGAMGWAQFMPSNYRRLAVDFNGDGKRDLWSAEDAIGSIARYFMEYDPTTAWHPGQPMVLAPRRFTVQAENVQFNQRSPEYTLAGLAALGAEPTREMPGDTRAGLLRLERDQGTEFWIALPNFYTVMRYNPRVFYALSVGQLAEAIARGIGEPAGSFTP